MKGSYMLVLLICALMAISTFTMMIISNRTIDTLMNELSLIKLDVGVQKALSDSFAEELSYRDAEIEALRHEVKAKDETITKLIKELEASRTP